jgi:branched-chain amino acid transport system permease protein
VSGLWSFDFWISVGVLAGIYAIFALGLQVQFGFTGLLNFGHVASMTISAYTMAILVIKLHTPLLLAAVTGVALATLFGIAIGLPALRLRHDFFGVATLVFAEIVRYIAINEDELTGGTQGTVNLLGPGKVATFNGSWLTFQGHIQDWLRGIFGDVADENVTMFVIIWLVVFVLILAVEYLVRSPWGRVLKAIREDEDAASALGKNVLSYKLQSLGLGALIGGIAGLFFAFHFSFFGPSDFDPLTTFYAFVIVILGGRGRNWGVPVGAVIFGVIFAGTRFLKFPPLGYLDASERASARLMLVGLILIALMAFRPQGIFGRRAEMMME